MPSQRSRGALDDVDFSTLLVKIGDLGGGNLIPVKRQSKITLHCGLTLFWVAVWSVQREEWPVTPTSLRAPELISRDLWDSGIDIWTLGCLVTCPS